MQTTSDNYSASELFKELRAIISTGDFSALPVSSASSVHSSDSEVISVALKPRSVRGELPIMTALGKLALASIPTSASFSIAPVTHVAVERYGVISAVDPLTIRPRAAAAKIVQRASTAAKAVRDAVAMGVNSRSLAATRDAEIAAGTLLKIIRALCQKPENAFHSWRHVLPATALANPLSFLSKQSVSALQSVLDILSGPEPIDSLPTKLAVSTNTG